VNWEAGSVEKASEPANVLLLGKAGKGNREEIKMIYK